MFDNVERRTVPLQLTLTGAESLDFFAILVVDIVPVLRGLNMAYALRPKSERREQHDYYENDIFHKKCL